MALRDGIARVGRFLGRRRREQVEAWMAVAARRGGRYTPERRRLIGWRSPAIDVELAEVAVHVDLHVVSTGQATYTYTRFRCRYLLGGGPKFEVAPAGIVRAIGTALGLDDVTIGADADFDARFVVRTKQHDATRRAWTREACRLLAGTLPAASVKADRGALTMQLLGIVREPEVIDAGVRILSELGATGAPLLETVRALPRAEAVRATGPWDERTKPGAKLVVRGVEVRLEPAHPETGLETHVVAALGRELPHFAIGVGDGGAPSAAWPAGALAGDTAALVPSVAPAAVACDGASVRVVVEGAPPPRRLEAAAELAAALALGTGTAGAYR